MSATWGLARLRSRVGLEAYLQAGLLNDHQAAAEALEQAVHPVTQALLLPFGPSARLAEASPAVEQVIVSRLRTLARQALST